MKDLLTEKTLLWAAVIALVVSSYFLHTDTNSSCRCGDRDATLRGRTGQMREKMGSRAGRWEGTKKQTKKSGEGHKKNLKNAKKT